MEHIENVVATLFIALLILAIVGTTLKVSVNSVKHWNRERKVKRLNMVASESCLPHPIPTHKTKG